MKLCDFKPCALLLPYISRYWLWENELQLPDVLPGSGAELFFYYRQPAHKIMAQHQVGKQLASVLIVPRTTLFHFEQPAALSFIAVRFRTGALRHFCPMPVAELTDQLYSVDDIWGSAGQQILQQVNSVENHTQRIQVIEQFLLTQFITHHKNEHPWLDNTFNQFYYAQPGLDEMVEQTDISMRHFQRILKQNAGVSPKYLQRIIKIQRVIRYLLLHKKQQYLDCALSYGYYDQSHFIKDFKHFTQQTPSHYFQEANFMSHFYNPPLR